ncbi:hypothetical protein SAMN05444274_11325 [Mariniphaga anaerophila]|uniref:Uncharacterized protein n=1 Tax=Mariniphaga anaerophila TaxID=1484053 RepID=A0A1M5FKS3_9BACT|nr:hypothetical protein SAMN05444274_11325 [Mariniphaga anaerophila]
MNYMPNDGDRLENKQFGNTVRSITFSGINYQFSRPNEKYKVYTMTLGCITIIIIHS